MSDWGGVLRHVPRRPPPSAAPVGPSVVAGPVRPVPPELEIGERELPDGPSLAAAFGPRPLERAAFLRAFFAAGFAAAFLALAFFGVAFAFEALAFEALAFGVDFFALAVVAAFFLAAGFFVFAGVFLAAFLRDPGLLRALGFGADSAKSKMPDASSFSR